MGDCRMCDHLIRIPLKIDNLELICYCDQNQFSDRHGTNRVLRQNGNKGQFASGCRQWKGEENEIY